MKKNCFTFVEILGVVAIIGILMAGTAVMVNRAWQNNRIDVCESELRDMTGAYKSYFIDYGNIIIAPDSNYETVLDETIELLNNKYLSWEIERLEIPADKKSVKLSTKMKEDPWGNKYNLNLYTYSGDDADGIPGMIVISSNGPDGVSSQDTYSTNNFGDDILAVIDPKK